MGGQALRPGNPPYHYIYFLLLAFKSPTAYMYKNHLFVFIICVFWLPSAFSQTNFRHGFEETDPVPQGSNISLEERLKLHEPFLERAIEAKDSLRQLYGNIYIFYDYLRVHNYAEATKYLLEAENIANQSGKPGWKGWATHRRAILQIILDEFENALGTYQIAADFCREAGDSLCLGESLEQMSAMHGQLDNFEEAHRYFNQAMPLIEKFGDKDQISASLSNFGILYSKQGRPAEAIPYFERSIAINHDIENYRAEGKARNNLADAYRRLGRYKQAISLFQECLEFNISHGLSENRITNYMGLYVTYDSLGDYRSANEVLIKHYALRDSLIGAQTQAKIADLEAKYDSQQKELALEKSRLQLVETRRSLERTATLFGLVVLVVIFGLFRWYRQRKKAEKELAENQENLQRVTRMLLDKNTQISALELQLSALEPTRAPNPEHESTAENIYSQRILTEADWTEFKIYFEKSYPGFLNRLRSSWPSLSEAEERLFLFLKLNLTRKEISAILGISSDSVKKTRTRLRKRLNLPSKRSLEEFVQNF